MKRITTNAVRKEEICLFYNYYFFLFFLLVGEHESEKSLITKNNTTALKSPKVMFGVPTDSSGFIHGFVYSQLFSEII